MEKRSERTQARKTRLREVLRQRQDTLALILTNIHDPHNVSAIYRTCDAFGVPRVYLHYTTVPFPALGKKSSASARKWVDTVRHVDKAELFHSLHDSGHQILATTFSKSARPLREWNFLKPTAIILGNEHAGVEQELVDGADGELYIPMHGMIQSFNVSVAAAIILAEAARQREEAGFYAREEWEIPNFETRLAQWLEK